MLDSEVFLEGCNDFTEQQGRLMDPSHQKNRKGRQTKMATTIKEAAQVYEPPQRKKEDG